MKGERQGKNILKDYPYQSKFSKKTRKIQLDCDYSVNRHSVLIKTDIDTL